LKSILVTGGRGFLGSHLVRNLRERDYRVRILVRDTGSGEDASGPEIALGDVRDKQAVQRAVDGMDAVIHTVSNFRRGGSDKNEAYAINVQGTLNVCEAAHAAGVRQMIHCSTIGVHGSVKEVPATETTPYNPGDLYQETKLQGEQAVWEFADRTGLPVTVIRPISMFGPGDTRMLKLFKMIKKRRFVMIGPGDVLFQPAYIDDVVRGFLLALGNERALGEAFIVGGEEYVPLHELVGIIAEELNVRPPNRRLPLGPVLLAARLCEAVCVPLGIEPPLHRRRVSFFQNNRAFCIDKVKQRLGFRSEVPLRDALRRTIAWYEEQGWL
jgi:nucleoside-diphosphate-sugar epimerase